MKTTLEIPDAIFRKAKSTAAEQGIPLREFVTQALTEKLKTPPSGPKRWAAVAGKLRHLRAETARINRYIEEEFERIEPESWK